MIHFILQFGVNFIVLYPIVNVVLSFYPIQEPHILELVQYLHSLQPSIPTMGWLTILTTTVLLLVTAAITTLRPLQWILCYSAGARKGTAEEMRLMKRIIEELCRRTGENPESYHVYVSNDTTLNAFALGRNNICVNRPCFQTFTVEELAGIVAHELGHLECRHTSYLLAIVGINQLTYFVLTICALLVNICGLLVRIPLLGIIFLFINWLLYIYTLFAQLLLGFPMRLLEAFTSQRNEYEADAYACKIGLARGLHGALTKLNAHEARLGFFEQLLSSHPVMDKRIQKITNYLENNV